MLPPSADVPDGTSIGSSALVGSNPESLPLRPSREADKEAHVNAELRAAQAGADATVVLTAADVGRCVDRIAHQIIETVAKADFDAALLGIPTRGVPLAHRLADRIAVF